MLSYTIQPPQKWRVIIAGGVVAAADALAERVGSRPLRDVSVNGYGGVHATVWADREQLADWFRASADRAPDGGPRPGALCWFRSAD